MDVSLCKPDDPRLPNPCLRHILVASGELPTPKTKVGRIPTMQLIDAAFDQTEIETLQTTDQILRDSLAHLNALDNTLIERVGATASPDMSKLEHLLKQIQSKTGMYLERRGYGSDVSLLKQIQTKVGTYMERKRSNSNESTGGRAPSVVGAPLQELTGQVTSKQEVLKALDMIVNYYEQNEPSSPVPLLIRRAKRLVGKSFVDIIRDLSPDAMSQVRMVSGESEESSEE
jgi:type VI secretion system protein ImpA